MKRLVLDVETTINNKGNPFDKTNKLCYVGLLSESTDVLYPIEYSSDPYGSNLLSIQSSIDDCELLIGFNIKFDLHWINRYGINFSSKRIWDCQLVHFILTGQTESYPSLNGVAAHYGLGTKLDVVSTEYWKNDIDTPDIPKDVLEEYLKGDLDLTYQVYLKQVEEVNAGGLPLQRLISLHNQDLLVLQEMEYNGLLYNATKSEELANELDAQIVELDNELYQYHNCDSFNPNSGDHLSCLLYGGSIKLSRKVPAGFYKTGARKGEVKERWEDYQVELPRLFTPPKGSELAKEGYFSTDEATLKSLKSRNQHSLKAIQTLLTRSDLEKRVSTYYRGLLKLATELNWKENKIHGQLNQCVARTGRLSSSKPNLQNFDGGIKGLFYSRFT
jgi:DNA polymerase I-like protein with 3'-5' exonuclease and polymerase domains